MERSQQLRQAVEQFQTSLDEKDYGHLGMGAAGALMLFVFCPMSIVAVAAPYWKSSTEMQGPMNIAASVSTSVSLWQASTSTEMNGVSADTDVGMCSDEMSGFDDCGKIHAIRFFTISAVLLSLASGLTLTLGFSNRLKPSAALRRKMSVLGVSLSAVVLLWDFLSLVIVATVEVSPDMNLSGAGFVFLILELLFVTAATVLVTLTLTRWSSRGASSKAAETRVIQIGKSNDNMLFSSRKSPSDASPSSQPQSQPTLLTQVVCSSPSTTPKPSSSTPKGSAGNAPGKEEAEAESVPENVEPARKATPMHLNAPEQGQGFERGFSMTTRGGTLKLDDVQEVDEKNLESSVPATVPGLVSEGESEKAAGEDAEAALAATVVVAS